MTLETIYYLTQIIAVLAVLGSLIFVGYQIRQNTEQARIQNAAHLQDRYDQIWLTLAESPELALACDRLLQGEKIDPAQASQLRRLIAMTSNVAMTAYIAEKQGLGSYKLAVESELFYLNFMGVPLGRAVHATLVEHMGDAFKADIAKNMANWHTHIEARLAERNAAHSPDSQSYLAEVPNA